ncbi:glycosyltransferase [Vreelandella sp.]|uniref:glycosyltransferase n=1 Tax=Vreelandella sp. TaxID=3137778 RepID=UPI003BAD2332
MSQRFTLLVAGDPNQRTGGYIYDAQIVAALKEQGVQVDVVGLEGRFPQADEAATRALANALETLADDERVIIDGLAMGALPDVVARHADRLDITSLLHHPLGDEQGLSSDAQQHLHRSELAGLAAVARVIVTSRFTARRLSELAERYSLPITAPITVVEPGVAHAPVSPAAQQGDAIRLLCVATLTPRKGQDVLVNALAQVESDQWQCDCFGGARDADFSAKVQQLIDEHQLAERVTLHGECDAPTLEAAYQNAHVLVLPSWYEGYGMVVTEALAHGLPVITTTGGALRDTLPEGAGISVAPGDVKALSAAISNFCTNEALRTELRAGVAVARGELNDWQAAGVEFAKALHDEGTAELSAGSQFAASWLTLREAVDSHARSDALVSRLNEWLATREAPVSLADLGCGRGSNMQFLAPRLASAQQWVLFDHDAALLKEARQRAVPLHDALGQPLKVETHCASLTTLDHPALKGVDVVSASALIDLVSQQWIDALVAQCAERQQALLVSLSVTGEWYFVDAEHQPMDNPEDRFVLGLFNAHQQRDKGLGEALGGDAHGALYNALAQRGYEVEEANTPWLLSAGNHEQQPLITTLINGWAEAATEQAPEAATRIAEWRTARLDAIERGQAGVWVGHRDLLALPAEQG